MLKVAQSINKQYKQPLLSTLNWFLKKIKIKIKIKIQRYAKQALSKTESI